MKRHFFWLCALSLLLLSACGPAPAEEPAPPEPEGPIELESLAVELRRDGVSSQDLARAVRELPELLRAALEAQEVEAGTVTVSVGSSPAAVAQAVGEGGVDVAFLPEADLALLEGPRRILTSGADGMAAVVAPENETLAGEAFASALARALEEVQAAEVGELAFGAQPYALPEDAGD